MAWLSLSAQQIGSWEDHLPYQNGVAITHSEDDIIVSAKSGIFYYSLEDQSLSKLSKADGLSDVSQWVSDNHQLIAYHRQMELLFIAYTNGNIDLIKDGEVINIPDIKNASIIGAKRIHAIDFIDNYAYLSTTFGVVVIDLENYQVKDTYKIGTSGIGVVIRDFTRHNDSFYAAAGNGLYRAPADGSVNLLNFNNWQQIDQSPLLTENVQQVFSFNDRLFAIQRDSIFVNDGSSWEYFYAEAGWQIINYSIWVNKLLITQGQYGSNDEVPEMAQVISFDTSGAKSIAISEDLLQVPYQAIEFPEDHFWVADFYDGLLKKTPEGHANVYPNGPGSERVFSMDIENEKLYVAAGGVNAAYNYKFIRDGFFIYEDRFWNTKNQYTHSILEEYLDLVDVVVHENTGAAYFASYYGGVVKYLDGQITTWNKDNSGLQSPAGDSARSTATGLAIDGNDNLWIANNNVSRPLVVITAEGASYNYGFPGNTSTGTDVIVDEYDQKWVVCDRDGDVGMVVYDNSGTLENTDDDQSMLINASSANGNLHTNSVMCAAVDHDGAVWAGTREGVAVFHCPGSVFTTGCDASRPLVEQEGNYNYLLENEVVNDIEIDGANRKWFATNSGVFLMDEDGEEQIEYFNATNSPLLSNVVGDITIDQKSGTVYFGTDNGIVSYVSTAANKESLEDDCQVYPNPVRPGYEGLVTIDGVVPNAQVKITDASGNLFYETQSLGTRVTWDVTNYNGERAKSGVYLLFISNEDGTATKICKLAIVN